MVIFVLTGFLFDFSVDFVSDSCANSFDGNFDILAVTEVAVVVVVDDVVVVVVVDDVVSVVGAFIVVDDVVVEGAAVVGFVVDFTFLSSDFS